MTQLNEPPQLFPSNMDKESIRKTIQWVSTSCDDRQLEEYDLVDVEIRPITK